MHGACPCRILQSGWEESSKAGSESWPPSPCEDSGDLRWSGLLHWLPFELSCLEKWDYYGLHLH